VIEAVVEGDSLEVSVEDFGVGIEDVKKAMEPMYTTRRDLERSGMGFVFMEAFMDSIQVESKLGNGTKVTMRKKIGRRYERQD
jgi:stage II sporulation protein AB (anti-sigma F factor)